MKKIRRILISILIISMIFSCVGCGKDTETVSNGLTAIKGKYLVNDGVSEYKIVVSKDAGSVIQVAPAEFNKFFSESTGVNLPVVTDDEIQSGDKYISIGETTLLKDAGISYDYDELGRDGYKIITEGDNLYLIGGADYGSLYAVYGLLEYIIDYDFFAEDCYTIAQGVEQIPLYEFDITDIPDIALRTASDGVVESSQTTLYRMRVRPYLEHFLVVNGKWAHNSLAYVQDSPDANAKWYNSGRTQLCYTAHGDEAEYNKMQNACFETLKKTLMEDIEKSSVMFTIEDNYDICSCEACNAMTEKYGAISSTIILFLNDLNALVKDWFETEEGEPYARDLKIIFFAYNSYEAAPASYNEETGKYEANEGIQLDEGVYCQLCPIFMDYYKPITDESNEEYCINMQKWIDMVEGKLYLWYYSTNFRFYLVPYDYFDTMVENYRFAIDGGTYYLFDQRQFNETGVVTGWSALKNYMNYKLAWDIEENVEELYDNFFDGYFGPASDDMREVFDGLRVLTNYNKENKNLGGRRSIYLEILDEEYWPKDVLEQWLNCFESAETKIADLKEKNPSQYEMYRDHINGEKLSVLYLFIQCYSYNTSEEVIDAYKTEFKQLAESFGLTYQAENQTISDFY